MQAGRELDVKVAQSLGYDVFEADGEYWVAVDDETADPLEHFSTTWEGMGVMREEARKKGYFFTLSDGPEKIWAEVYLPMKYLTYAEGDTVPHAACLAFVKCVNAVKQNL
jgi:hypothetical protein